MGIKTIAAWSNPLVYIIGAPIFLGIVLAASTYNIFRNTTKICKEIKRDW